MSATGVRNQHFRSVGNFTVWAYFGELSHAHLIKERKTGMGENLLEEKYGVVKFIKEGGTESRH